MNREAHLGSRQVKEILHHGLSPGKENQETEGQHGGECGCRQGRIPSSSSSSSSSSDPQIHSTGRARGEQGDLQKQAMMGQHGRSHDLMGAGSTGSSSSSSSSNIPESQRMKEQGIRGGVSQASSSSSLYPSSSSCSAKAARERKELENRMTKTQQGSKDGVNQAGCFPSSSSSSSHSTSSQQRKSDDKSPEKQGMKMGDGRGEGFGHAGSSFSSSPSSPQKTRYGSEGQRWKGPEMQTKTRHGSGAGLGQFDPLWTPPSSPSKQRFERERQAEEDREEPMLVDNWFEEEKTSSCCTLTELKRIEQCRDDLGPLKPGKKHTVLVDSSVFSNARQISPLEGKHAWKGHFVKLPFLQQSQVGFSPDSRWDQIRKRLSSLGSKPTADVHDVVDAILHFNPKYRGQWSFESLHKFVQSISKREDYVHALFPRIAALAVKLPEEVKTAIPLLRSGHVAAITLSQAQIACLLANAFFCTFPHRNTTRPDAEYHNYPSINFSSLFGSRLERKNEKLRAIMHYFNIVTDLKTDLSRLVTFERRVLRGADVPPWRSCTEKINKLYVSSEGHIEKEGLGLLQVDFANSWVGGGVLGSGLVQEEILFLINPELIVSRLFTERLQDNECLVITGSQQFSSYMGYGDSFVWLGPHEDRLQRDDWYRLKRQIVAIDALHYRNRREQYSMDKITRELNKAYCGFKGNPSHEKPDIATGKWGCGAFNGDPQLKAVIQLMVAAKAGRGLAFFTFQDRQLERALRGMHHLLVTSGITVGKLYGLLQDYCSTLEKLRGVHLELYDFLRKTLDARSKWSQL